MTVEDEPIGSKRERGGKEAPGRPRAEPRYFATAAKGTEPLLRDELKELRLPAVRADRGGVHFGLNWEHAARACLWSRIALRIQQPIARFGARSQRQLYEGVRSVDWTPYVDAGRTLAVRAACRSSQLTHTQFISQVVKDAIVDQLRDRSGSRPNVAKDDPDLVVFLHLVKDEATVSVDLSGASLHARGLREAGGGTAPLRETLAAALVRFSGWDRASPLLDPMCGSGTLLLEAASWALGRAPGLARKHFGFEQWPSFDSVGAQTMAGLREQARSSEKRELPPIVGSDLSESALAIARANAAHAGVPLRLERRSIAEVRAGADQSTLLLNPPYGERLARPESLIADVDSLLERFHRSERALIVPAGTRSRLSATAWLAVCNGPIDCELRRYGAALDSASSGS